jgi:hypothetical protein
VCTSPRCCWKSSARTADALACASSHGHRDDMAEFRHLDVTVWFNG